MRFMYFLRMALIMGKLSPQNAQRTQKNYVFYVLFAAIILKPNEKIMAGG
jgi:hypothetical protein